MKDAAFIQEMRIKGEEAAQVVRVEFNGMAPEQLDWKPSREAWSIGQCFDHLVTSNTLYFPAFTRILARDYEMTRWQRWSPLGGFFGRMLSDQLGEKVHRRLNSPSVFRPTNQPIDAAVVERFLKHQDTLLEFISRFGEIDLDKIQVTSPASSFVTYSLRHAVTILISHELRHIAQAMRVRSDKGFPPVSQLTI